MEDKITTYADYLLVLEKLYTLLNEEIENSECPFCEYYPQSKWPYEKDHPHSCIITEIKGVMARHGIQHLNLV